MLHFKSSVQIQTSVTFIDVVYTYIYFILYQIVCRINEHVITNNTSVNQIQKSLCSKM